MPRDPANSACCHLTTRDRNAGRRRFACMWTRGSRNVARSTRVTRLPPPPPPPPLRVPSFRVEMEGASRRNVTRIPSPVPSAPASRGPMARRRRSVLHFFPLAAPPSPSTRARAHSLAHSLPRADNRAVSLASSRRLVLGPSPSPPPLSACVPETPDSFLPPFSFSRPFRLSPRSYAGCLVRPPPLSPLAAATPGVSRRLDAALR